MRTFNHVGIITNENQEGAMFNEGLNVWLTDYSKSPNKIEFLKFDDPAKSCLPELVKSNGHIAYTVPSLDEAERCKGNLWPGCMRRTSDYRFHRRRRHRNRINGNQIIYKPKRNKEEKHHGRN